MSRSSKKDSGSIKLMNQSPLQQQQQQWHIQSHSDSQQQSQTQTVSSSLISEQIKHKDLDLMIDSYPIAVDETTVYEYEVKGLWGPWKSDGLCSVHKDIKCDHLFDPKKMATMTYGPWMIDLSGCDVDADGWSYASSRSTFKAHGVGNASKEWNSYCRRRKWLFRGDKLKGTRSLSMLPHTEVKFRSIYTPYPNDPTTMDMDGTLEPPFSDSFLKYNSIPVVKKSDNELSYVDEDQAAFTTPESKEYLIDLAFYYPELLIDDIDNDPLLKQDGVMDYSCEFALQGSGFEGNEIIIVIPAAAALKIFNHTNRQSSLLTVKEIPTSIDGEFVSSIISFEPSGVVFTTPMKEEDGRLDRKDCLIVTIPTMMTWEGNVELASMDIISNLELLGKDHEDDKQWGVAFDRAESDFNGVIAVNPNDGKSRITATFVVDHFSCYVFGSISSLFRKSAYALCAIRKGDSELSRYKDSSSFKIQCCVCKDDPNLLTIIEDKCYFVVQAIHWKTICSNHMHANFLFTSYEDTSIGYYLTPLENDTKVEITDVCEKYYPDFNRNLGRYKLVKGTDDLRMRSHIKLTVNGKLVPTVLIIEIPLPVEEVPIRPSTLSEAHQSSIHQSSAFNYKQDSDNSNNTIQSTDYTQIALQVGGALCNGLLLLSKQVPIIKNFANVLEGALKLIKQAIRNQDAFKRLNTYLVQISRTLLPSLAELSSDPSFKEAFQNLISTLEHVIKFVQAFENSVLTKVYDTRDNTTVLDIDNFINQITNCKDILMDLVQMEDHKKINQIASFLLDKHSTESMRDEQMKKKKSYRPVRLDKDGWQEYNPRDFADSSNDNNRELGRQRTIMHLGGNVANRSTHLFEIPPYVRQQS